MARYWLAQSPNIPIEMSKSRETKTFCCWPPEKSMQTFPIFEIFLWLETLRSVNRVLGRESFSEITILLSFISRHTHLKLHPIFDSVRSSSGRQLLVSQHLIQVQFKSWRSTLDTERHEYNYFQFWPAATKKWEFELIKEAQKRKIRRIVLLPSRQTKSVSQWLCCCCWWDRTSSSFRLSQSWSWPFRWKSWMEKNRGNWQSKWIGRVGFTISMKTAPLAHTGEICTDTRSAFINLAEAAIDRNWTGNQHSMKALSPTLGLNT